MRGARYVFALEDASPPTSSMPQDNHPPGYVDPKYLDSVNAHLRLVKQRSYELMRVCEGQTVLDLGCGVGIDTLGLAELVGGSGRVFGVDFDPDMVAEANRRARQAALEGRVSHQLGEASALAQLYADEYFDACRSERMLMHMREPFLAVKQLWRVLKPGGWLVLVEPDWKSASIASEKVDIERRLARIRGERFLRSGYAGGHLYQWMLQAGFQDLVVEITPFWLGQLALVKYLTVLDEVEDFALARGLVSDKELDEWRSDLRRMDELGQLFATVNMITVAGRK